MKHARGRTGDKVLFDDGRAALSFRLYAPGQKQATHAHAAPSIALMLCGALREDSGGGSTVQTGPAIGIKPDAVRHGNCYGPDGAILLSVTVRDPALWAAVASGRGWDWQPAGRALRALAAQTVAGRVTPADFAAELLAAARVPAPAIGAPPAWLRRARAALADAPGLPLDAVARDAGVHRVHLSRSFSRWYGETITHFRLRRRTEVGLRLVLHDGLTAAAGSCEAGFADQSHFARSLRRIVGARVGTLVALAA